MDTMKGLCGNFNGKKADDFAARQGQIESTVIQFANSWTDEEAECPPVTEPTTSPCEQNPERKAYAETACMALRTGDFELCHNLVWNSISL